MTDHTHTTITPGCFRCDLNADEALDQMLETREDAQAAWLEYRDADMAANPTRYALPRRRDFIAGFIAGRES